MHCLGLDIGYGEIKAVYRDETGAIRHIICPSIYAKVIRNSMSSSNSIISVAGQDYYVGEDARKEIGQISPADYTDILECTSIFSAFVKREMGVSENISVVGSVPPNDWQKHNAFKDELEKNFDMASVALQGMGAIETVIDRIEAGSRVLVLDIGYNTVDHLLVDKKENGGLEICRGGTWRDAGVTFLVSQFKAEIDDTELRNLRFHVLKEFLRNGKASFHGQDIDLSGAKRRAELQYRRITGSRIKEELGGEAQSLNAMVCCGGGVHYMEMEGFFGRLPVIQTPRTEFANAHGQMLIAEKGENDPLIHESAA